ncbi:hypothetical protein CRENBAI_010733 [Crenichthys baileyi]|uniref:Uncharacterized protein n=1 Tax=Crenichthys baileyi TaxID=28760 RepID=A0AAV9RSI8_9TELE
MLDIYWHKAVDNLVERQRLERGYVVLHTGETENQFGMAQGGYQTPKSPNKNNPNRAGDGGLGRHAKNKNKVQAGDQGVVPSRHRLQAGARTCNTESWAVGGEGVGPTTKLEATGGVRTPRGAWEPRGRSAPLANLRGKKGAPGETPRLGSETPNEGKLFP